MTHDRILEIIQQSFDSLHEAQLLEEPTSATEDTVLIGTGTRLDSIGFVTFITELEDRIQQETGEDHPLVLGDIHEANTGNSKLTVGRLARYVEQLVNGR